MEMPVHVALHGGGKQAPSFPVRASGAARPLGRRNGRRCANLASGPGVLATALRERGRNDPPMRWRKPSPGGCRHARPGPRRSVACHRRRAAPRRAEASGCRERSRRRWASTSAFPTRTAIDACRIGAPFCVGCAALAGRPGTGLRERTSAHSPRADASGRRLAGSGGLSGRHSASPASDWRMTARSMCRPAPTRCFRNPAAAAGDRAAAGRLAVALGSNRQAAGLALDRTAARVHRPCHQRWRRLYITETDLDSGAGLIGVRDAKTLEKLAEWPTHGIDPHQLVWDAGHPGGLDRRQRRRADAAGNRSRSATWSGWIPRWCASMRQRRNARAMAAG
jgi:hypothetical protein